MTTLPTRAQIDNAGAIDFDQPRSEKDVSITIEVGPAGITVRCDYLGKVSSIPAAIERLRAAGVLELVSAARPTATAPLNGASKPKAERVEPIYKASGEACCPIHKRELQQGKWGLFCSAKDRETGEYCKLKFNE